MVNSFYFKHPKQYQIKDRKFKLQLLQLTLHSLLVTPYKVSVFGIVANHQQL